MKKITQLFFVGVTTLTLTLTLTFLSFPLFAQNNLSCVSHAKVGSTDLIDSIPIQVSVVPLENSYTYFEENKKIHIFSEFIITNLDKKPIEIKSISISTMNNKKNKIISKQKFEGKDLESMFSILGGDYIKDQTPILKTGRSGIIFLETTTDSKNTNPSKLSVTFNLIEENGNKTISITPNNVSLVKEKNVVISAPVKGKNWVSVNGPSNKSLHRRILMAQNGRIIIPEKYAVDWVKINDNRDHIYINQGNANEDYFSFGQEVLAVADGTIVVAKDGIANNILSTEKNQFPITKENVSGNYIVLKIGKDVYASYAHLGEGTLRVKVNDKVHKGQILALIGNSGNSSAPHLHFQLSSTPNFFNSNGIYYKISKFIKHEYALDVANRVQVISSNKLKNEAILENNILDF